MYQWRKFQFFDKESVRIADAESAKILEKLPVTCATSGRNSITLGDAEGFIRIFDRNFSIEQDFQAYQIAVTHLRQAKNCNLLISVGDDGGEPNNSGIIKIWNLDKKDKNGYPSLMKGLRPFSTKFPETKVMCFEVNDDLNIMALGLANGLVLLFKGDIYRSPKPKVLELFRTGDPRLDNDVSVTSVSCKKLSNLQYALFITTKQAVFSFILGSKDDTMFELDQSGAQPNCSLITDEGNFIIARNEALYYFEPDGRGPCLAFDAAKKKAVWFRSYLLVECVDANDPKKTLINIYDLKNKLNIYSGPFSHVSHILFEWGSVFLLTQEFKQDGSFVNKFFQLEEKDTQTKLDMLFKKNLFSVAINLAHMQKFDYAYIVDIFRKYGDHLYKKGDYDAAIGQYLHTIGRLEPSYVIRNFLDARRIHNLTRYLDALHDKKLATSDHTTLLLNCYTKLKEVDKLEEFIKTGSQYHFDVSAAIKVCRQAGYFEHALYLAYKNNDDDMYLKVLLEDVHDYTEALAHIASLDFEEAEKYLIKYGKTLITHLPAPTTQLLIELCTSYKKMPRSKKPKYLAGNKDKSTAQATANSTAPNKDANKASSNANQNSNPATPDLNKSPPQLSSLLSYFSSGTTTAQSSKDNTGAVNEDFLSSGQTSENKEVEEEPVSLMSTSILTTKDKTKDKRSSSTPEQFLHVFSEHQYSLMIFLEEVVKFRPTAATQAIYNTLLELYLHDNQEIEQNTSREELHKKALDLLKSKDAKYDNEHALILVQNHNFREGILIMYEKLELHYDIVQYYMEQNDYENVIMACKKYGTTNNKDKDANIWIQVLNYFTTCSSTDREFNDEIMHILQYIDHNDLLPPLIVVQILSQNSKMELGTIKEYLIRRLHQQQELIAQDQNLIKNYQTETKKMKDEIKDLQTNARIFQMSKCTGCMLPLELPVVHFLCMHSYHYHCLPEKTRCPNCAAENRKVIEIKQNLEASAKDHNEFTRQLEGSTDGFSTVSDYFGRGIFSKFNITPKAQDSTEDFLSDYDDNYDY